MGGDASEWVMRSDGIVLFQPLLGDLPGLGQAIEQVEVKHLLTISAIEALDNGIVTNDKFGIE